MTNQERNEKLYYILKKLVCKYKKMECGLCSASPNNCGIDDTISQINQLFGGEVKIVRQEDSLPIIIDKSVKGIVLAEIVYRDTGKVEKCVIVDKLDRLKWTTNFTPPTEKLFSIVDANKTMGKDAEVEEAIEQIKGMLKVAKEVYEFADDDIKALQTLIDAVERKR